MTVITAVGRYTARLPVVGLVSGGPYRRRDWITIRLDTGKPAAAKILRVEDDHLIVRLVIDRDQYRIPLGS